MKQPMELVRAIVGLVLWIALPLAFELWDKRRLDPEARERAWNGASWGAALYAFGPFSLLGWFFVTRRGFARALGLPLGAFLFALEFAVDVGLDALAGG